MSWESGEGDKQAEEACLPCITRHGESGTGLASDLVWDFFFFQTRARMEHKF